jgi:hypothetical protein
MASAAARRLPTAIAVAAVSLCCAAGALGRAYVPPHHHIFSGLTGGKTIDAYERMVGKHPPVFEVYMTWNTPTQWLADRTNTARVRLGIHISTAAGYGRAGVISPGAIAAGASDRFLLQLNHNLAFSRRVIYVRLMAEMNGHWNAYAAFNADGSSRGPANSAHSYIKAWRRTVLIVRGGSVARINRRLRGEGLPRIQTPLHRRKKLPRPKVAFLWVPQDAGSPDTAQNSPAAYWPGGPYVDWVGTDFYAASPNFGQLSRFYGQFAGKPFVLSEWGLYGFDDPVFVRQVFAWVRSHPRVRMLNYYQGFSASSPANLARYPSSRRVLRHELRSRRFLAYAPEYAHPRHRRPAPPEQPPPQPPTPGPPPGPPPPGGTTTGPCLTPLPICLPPLQGSP